MLPTEIGDAAQNGDRDRVMAWLNAGGSINDVDGDGYTLLNCCASGDLQTSHPGALAIGDGQVALARDLIALGADVNIAGEAKTGGLTALHEVARKHRDGQAVLEMLSLLLGAGANLNTRDRSGDTPLYHALWHAPRHSLRMVTELLRAGASLDVSHGDYAPSKTAEDVLQRRESYTPNLAEDEDWVAAKRLVAGVRQHGSYKRYARSFHRDVLAVRGLAQRGKLSTNDPVLNFLARLGDNGVCWHILSF